VRRDIAEEIIPEAHHDELLAPAMVDEDG